MQSIPRFAFGWLVAILALGAPALMGTAPRFEERTLPHASGNYAGVAAADLNGDGHTEILVGRREGEEGLCLFTFAGEQWTRQMITTSGNYGGVALADITGDGTPDVLAAVTKGNSNGLELFETELRGAEIAFNRLPSPLTGVKGDDVAAGDIDSDGDTDVAVSTGGKRGITVLLNEGKGRKLRLLTLPTGTYEDTGLGLGDVNGDGRLDAISSNHPGKPLSLFLCSPRGEVSFTGPHNEGLPGAGIGYRIAIADLNGDKHADIAVGSSRGGMRLFMGNGCQGPKSGWWKQRPLGARAPQTMQVSLGDLDSDGRPDLAYSSTRGIVAVLNQGGGAFSDRLSAGLPNTGRYAGCVLVDWEGDGDLDLVCTSFHGEGIKFFENTGE